MVKMTGSALTPGNAPGSCCLRVKIFCAVEIPSQPG